MIGKYNILYQNAWERMHRNFKGWAFDMYDGVSISIYVYAPEHVSVVRELFKDCANIEVRKYE